MAKRILEVVGLYKYFGGLAAVNCLDFYLEEGEILGLIGPNGSGKTTVFNLIAGVLKPDKGKIYFYGEEISGKGPASICQMGIGRTFQIPLPFNRLTVLENVKLARLYGSKPAKNINEAEKEADEIVEFIGLKSRRLTIAGNLTILDRKRLELGKALATRPKLLLLDEILGGLTPKEIEDAIGLIMAIKATGISMIIVEHVMKAIMGFSDRVIVLNSGIKIAEGKPREVILENAVIEAYLGKGRYAKS